MKEALLGTKIRIPSPPPTMVPRSRLQEQLDAGLTTPFILISAPAGFGKTCMLSEWLADRRDGSAWIALDSSDNDPVRFMKYFISSIEAVEPGAGESALSVLSASPPGPPELEPLITLIINELSPTAEHLVIVLDDYHVIDNAAIHRAVTLLIESLPTEVHLIISTRSDPPFPIARWRTRGQMVEIRGKDLRFSLDETTTFFTQVMGLDLSADDIAALDIRTEGWVAGLHLAALSMRGRKNTSDFIKTFSGSNRYIMDFLVEEVLRRQTDEMQAFLLQTSILDKLTGPLCNKVTGQEEGQRTLAELERANVFLVAMDDERLWYRYHRLFADLLQARLHESRSELMARLHQRAAQWYEDNDMIADAVHHALAASDFERAAYLMEENAMALMTHGEMATLLTWIKAMPQEVISRRPRLCVFHAWLLSFSGKTDDAEPLLDQAERNIPQDDQSAEAQEVRGTIAALRAFIADMKGDTTLAIELAKQANKLLAETSNMLRTFLPFLLAKAYRLGGDLKKASRSLQELARMGRAADNIWTTSVAHFELAFIWKLQGKLRQAEDIYQETLGLASDQGSRHFASMARIYAGMSDLLREWNDLEAARRYSIDSIEGMKLWKNPTDLAIAHLALARVLLAQGDLNGASDELDKTEQIKRNASLIPPLDSMIATERVNLWLAQGNLAAANRWVEECHPGSRGSVIACELEQIAMARVLIAQGKMDDASSLLIRIGKAAEEGGRRGRLIKILALQALAFKDHDADKALPTLAEAVALAEPEGYVRVFIEEGRPMAQLLLALRRQPLSGASIASVSREYIAELLAAFPHEELPDVSGLVEPLSGRELEVLHLMREGYSNKKIADKLFVSINTVRSHTKNINSKLNVHSRTEAIARAKELGLIE